MSTYNQHGLSRDIPAEVKRRIRQRCGFGCVICGNAIYQYEHLDPPFSKAIRHDPDHIVLLCGGCHDRVTRGLLSKETVRENSLHPKCQEQGFSFGPFDVGTEPPEITIGTLTCRNVTTLISVEGDAVLCVRPAIHPKLPFLINAFLCDTTGKEILRIVDNEWQTPSSNWDVSVVGRRIKIQGRIGSPLLVLRSDPPNRLIVEKMNMQHKGIRIEGRENQSITIVTSGRKLTATRMSIKDCAIGIDVAGDTMIIGQGGGEVNIDRAEFTPVPRPKY